MGSRSEIVIRWKRYQSREVQDSSGSLGMREFRGSKILGYGKVRI